MSDIGIQLQMKNGANIADNDFVRFDNKLIELGSISYNGVNGQITINKKGIYYIDWWVATQATLQNYTQFSIVTQDNKIIPGNSPNLHEEVTGNALIEVTSVPYNLQLKNTTNKTVYYSQKTPIKANLTIIEEASGGLLNLEDGNATGSLRQINSATGYTMGENSIALGEDTFSVGRASHAEGVNTKALGEGSHSEGLRTTAYAGASHAEGANSVSNGYASHAEGDGTLAQGYQSHAEGQVTNAIGSSSHAEGQGTTASGNTSHAEGNQTEANGYASHAEGNQTQALGRVSHAEGDTTKAVGTSSHAEGYQTKATGFASHAEGERTTASGRGSHAEGIETVAKGVSSHAEGYQTYSNGAESHAEGNETSADGFSAHAEGDSTEAVGDYSHAEGLETIASGLQSHAQGYKTRAIGENSHAEGLETTASGENSHAEGNETKATGLNGHAEGYSTVASGRSSHAQGYMTTASGDESHAEGSYTIASEFTAHAQGYNNIADSIHSFAGGNGNTTNGVVGAFIIGKFGEAKGLTATTGPAGSIGYNNGEYGFFLGNGQNAGAKGLAAAILSNGALFIDGGVNTPASDYAEMFETIDGNSIEAGYFVTFEDKNKIRIANKDDKYILGIVSATPGVIGNHHSLRWKDKYRLDEWGRIIYHEVDIDGVNRVEPMINPNWDNSQEYIPRINREEWVAVGMLGQLRVRDNGECVVNGYCNVGEGGIAVPTESGYRVLDRINENQIIVLFNFKNDNKKLDELEKEIKELKQIVSKIIK